MDRVERYREAVVRLVEEYASYRPANGQIDTEAVVDRDRDHYEVMHIGWDGVTVYMAASFTLTSATEKCGCNTTVQHDRSRKNSSPPASRERTSYSGFIRQRFASTPSSRSDEKNRNGATDASIPDQPPAIR